MATVPTTKEYIKRLDAKFRQVKELDKEWGKTFAFIHSDHAQDIFVDGLDGETYSTKPTFAGGNVFGNRNKFGTTNYTFATKAGSNKYFGSDKKRASATWRGVSTPRGPRNLILIEGGYKEIRQADGRQTKKVDLTHTGRLQKDFRSSLTKIQGAWITGVRESSNTGKLNGAVKRYGKKMSVSQKILDKYTPRLGTIIAKFVTV